MQLFAGQPDVIVTPDGAIHYEPDLFLKKGNASGSGGSTSINKFTDENDQDWFSSDGEITLVDAIPDDIKLDALTSKVNNELEGFSGCGTEEQPYDLMTFKHNSSSMFIELCDTCGNDVEDHDAMCAVVSTKM
ncbi:hypothetical protein C8R42DRAFT_641183 [Lentinula raphanica]|nr:hypothetical protein C8R42DRAFT_641183 [Lentinula raphanica]